MSCNIKLCGRLIDVGDVQDKLLDCDAADTWLLNCHISPSPTGELLVLAHNSNVVVATSKWDSSANILLFGRTSYRKGIADVDTVSSVLSVPIVGQNHSSQAGPDWTCVIVGFKSGFVRFYTEELYLLFEQQYHDGEVYDIKCQSQHSPRPDLSSELRPEDFYVSYRNILCQVNGPQLINVLRQCRTQLAKDQADGYNYIPPTPDSAIALAANTSPPRKWLIADQVQVTDVAVAGLQFTSTFDHLLVASTCGGFDTRFRAMPPHHTLIVAVGSNPYVGFHFALEGGAAGMQPVLQDVARVVVSKFKSALPGWLTGKQQPERQDAVADVASQATESTACRFGLNCTRRMGQNVVLSPDRRYAAVNDDLGRVAIISVQRGIVLRFIKGYRNTELAFAQVPDERKSKNRHRTAIGLFLVIYCRKRALLDIYAMLECTKVASFTAHSASRLLYSHYGLFGFQATVKTKFICPYTVLLLDPDGGIKELVIPFHCALPERNNVRAKDMHLYKRLKQLLRSESYDTQDLAKLSDECYNTCSQIVMADNHMQCMEMLTKSKCMTSEIIVRCADYYLTSCTDKEFEKIRDMSRNLSSLCTLYDFISTHFDADTDFINGNVQEKQVDSTDNLSLPAKQMENLQRLLDLSTTNDNAGNLPMRVKFVEPLTNYSVSEFLHCFRFDESNDYISLVETLGEDLLFRCAEFLYQNYITYKFSDEQAHKTLIEQLVASRIKCEGVMFLLLSFWVNRELNIKINLENEMYNLSKIIYHLTATIDSNRIVAPYNSTSPFWTTIRDILSHSARPFPALMAAIFCKSVAHRVEQEREDLQQSGTSIEDIDIEIWETLTQENCQWSLLIGKLEDVSLLNIILGHPPETDESHVVLKLDQPKVDVSLQYILGEGKGSVSELIAKWLTSGGIAPEVVRQSDQILRHEHLHILRSQFPYSLDSSVVLANMCWEYLIVWQKNMSDISFLQAAMKCLANMTDPFLKSGLNNLVWSTHLKILLENTARLINIVGKLPKEKLCVQDTGLSDYQITLFIQVCSDLFASFLSSLQDVRESSPRPPTKYEQLWQDDEIGKESLCEIILAHSANISPDLVLLHHQLTTVLRMVSTFNIRHPKMVTHMFDSTCAALFYSNLQQPMVTINWTKSDGKITASRLQFMTKVILSSIETIAMDENDVVHAVDHVRWMGECYELARIWNLNLDVLRRYQIAQLYANGYDSLAEELLPTCSELNILSLDLLIIAGKRLSKLLNMSANFSGHIAAFSTTLTSFLNTLNGEWCAPVSLTSTAGIVAHCIHGMDETRPEFKLALLMSEACETLKDLQ